MTHSTLALASVSNEALLSATWSLLRKTRAPEADLLVHLGEIDERKLYLDLAFPSMFAFCVGELGLSEDVAYNRISVARAARRFPLVIESLRSGKTHLAGLRLLVPHLTAESHVDLLAQAAGKSKREIEELVAQFAPQAAVVTSIRKLPQRSSSLGHAGPPMGLGPTARRQAVLEPLAEDLYKIQFTAGRALRDKIRQAQDLLRHRVPDGDLSVVVEKAIDLLIEKLGKERFAAGGKSRRTAGPGVAPASRHIPAAMKRAVYERDGGRCTFVGQNGRRCAETGGLEFDHLDGFARTRRHQLNRIALRCRAHNQHAAEQMYGRAFITEARAGRGRPRAAVAASMDHLPSG